ncbi:helix-turn-helix domain-containing protein [Rhodopirellula sp. SWK7]|uniref:helix-turn-helix domain-containing protein n=1 Tax=Rhodopirellula sp. SWK7 TaxID=595460 RepID=UPI0002BDE0A5|nr:helix-turn-helix domain-containing protein [Rhodopirellula sp. SWK7]EMI40545.1 hypothetical protein RRSWK_06954 [Rhodopirellula sp. SWK7]
MNRQQDLFTDLPRGEQLAALRRLKLSTHEAASGRVSGAVQKAVLKAIDDHEGDRASFASQKTIAEETGYGVSTVRRAIAALVDRDLITRDRPNHWSPNHHRVNWTEVTRRSRQDGERPMVQGERSRAQSGTCESSGRHPREFTEVSPSVQGDPRNAHRNDQLNAPSTATPDEWVRLRRRLSDLGMKAATQATAAARERGLSIEYIEDLITAATKPSGPEPPAGVGWLCHWLTGKSAPPFDEAESERRRAEREAKAATEAESIRERVHGDPKAIDADPWVIHGIAFRKLAAAGLDRFATDAERDGAATMDAVDRQRGDNPPEPEKQTPVFDAHGAARQGVTVEPSNQQSVTQSDSRDDRQFGNVFRRVPLGKRGNRAVAQRRAEILDALN